MKSDEIPDFLRSKGYVFTYDEKNEPEKFHREMMDFTFDWRQRCEEREYMICNKLVEHGVFKSKNEARMMINNGGVSIIPCIDEDYEVSCFEVECESEDLDAPRSTWEYFVQVGTEKQYYKKGYVLSPDRTHIPAKLWDVRFCNIDLLNYREKLMYDTAHNPFYSLLIKNPNKGFLENETMAVITWDKEFGKNPWLITDPNMQYVSLMSGYVIKIGKKKTIVIE